MAVVLRPRSIPALTPPLDRDVISAVLARASRWARTPGELCIAASNHYGRMLPRWAPQPEQNLCEALREALGEKAGPIAAPAWSRPGYREVLPSHFSEILWMDPAEGRLDPGADEIADAIHAGAVAVLYAPIVGDCSELPKIERLCRDSDVLLALDARASVGSRVHELGPEDFGDLLLLPADGEPVPSLFSGAVIFGCRNRASFQRRPRTTLRRSLPLALRLVARTVRYEPRLRTLWSGPKKAASAPHLDPDKAPRWAFAAAQARLFQSSQRWSQRARHVRSLHLHCSHLPGSSSIDDQSGSVTAGAAYPLLVADAELVSRKLQALGVQCVPGLAGWLAPKAMRGRRAQKVAAEAIFLPLHPFYRPEDMGFLSEAVRRAVLRSGGGVPDAPAPALEPLPSHTGHDDEAEQPLLRIVRGGAA